MHHVLAASRRGFGRLVPFLEGATGDRFTLIEDPADFTTSNLERLAPHCVFLPHWSHIIPAEINENFECIMFHMTDLPNGRGGEVPCRMLSAGESMKPS
jgi:methionyl-tRNA formyltransferase